MAEKPKGFNPQLNYRVEKRIQDEYKAVCEENCLNPGKLIRQFMLDTIEKYKSNGKKQ
jgi:antitoxin component of RelBE/YafQ-DinJ toxin-antitoxin module